MRKSAPASAAQPRVAVNRSRCEYFQHGADRARFGGPERRGEPPHGGGGGESRKPVRAHIIHTRGPVFGGTDLCRGSAEDDLVQTVPGVGDQPLPRPPADRQTAVIACEKRDAMQVP